MIVRALASTLVVGALLAAGLASAALAQTAPPPGAPPGGQPPAGQPPGMVDPVGVYKVTGSNPDGSAYSGTITVTKAGLVWRVVWKAGDQTVNGTALIMNGVLAVGYEGGVGVYRAQGNGWVGEWAERGQTAIGKESWERQ
jgi:hypothetical protein